MSRLHVTCDMSCVMCYASHVTFFFFFSDKVFDLVFGGSVINGAHPEGELPCERASIALRKVLAHPEMFCVYNVLLLNYHIPYRFFALSPGMSGRYFFFIIHRKFSVEY